MSAPKYDGVSFTLGGETFIVPPLNLKALQDLATDLNQVGALDNGVLTPEQITMMLRIMHAAFRRNYPEITVNDLAEIVDIGNMNAIFNAIMAQSNLEKKEVLGN